MHKMSLLELLNFISESIELIQKRFETAEYWSNIIKLRDLISHHYIDIDAETIYMICDEKMEELKTNIQALSQSI